MDFEWTGSSASMCEKKKPIFQILIFFFLQSTISSHKGSFHKKEGATKGNCNLSVHPTSAVQKQSDFTKGSFHFIPQGACENTFFQSLKIVFFAESGLSDGLVWGQRKWSCNMSFLSLTRAALNTLKDRITPQVNFFQ